jgi:hypothetical protein
MSNKLIIIPEGKKVVEYEARQCKESNEGRDFFVLCTKNTACRNKNIAPECKVKKLIIIEDE